MEQQKHISEDATTYFLTEVFGFTDEQSAAMYYQTEMTQEIYDSIIDRCFQLGKGADKVLFRMINEFPELFEHNVTKILKGCGIES